MKSNMIHMFSQVPKAEIQRSAFDRSHGYKTTFDAGYLVPIYIDEALPGDTHILRLNSLARLATPKVPLMDNMFMDFFFFSVPIRLIWENFQKFMGEKENPDDTDEYLVPQVEIENVEVGSLHDYFGLPLHTGGVGNTISVCAFWHRAYNLIWNEWFRDQNLQDSAWIAKDDGTDVGSYYELQRRGKRHDYFTSCLPFLQKGDAVSLPLGTTAPIKWRTRQDTLDAGADGIGVPIIRAAVDFDALTAGDTINNYNDNFNTGNDGTWVKGQAELGKYFSLDPQDSLYTDLAESTGATINSLREAFQLQRLLERDARGGTRYTEVIKAHFGVSSPDSRLQRPEYLGGGSQRINITPVPQTSESDGTPQGTLAGYGTTTGEAGFTASFTEHCVLMGLVSVRADLNYQQGLERMWSRSTKYDFYWPALSHLGEQAVLNKEIYFSDNPATDNGVFGYQERYAEYRYKPSKITGQFRSDYATPLDMWHLAQDFANLPVLNGEFIMENPPIDRVIAVPSEPHFLYDSFINLKSVRPMPVYSVPGLVDHF